MKQGFHIPKLGAHVENSFEERDGGRTGRQLFDNTQKRPSGKLLLRKGHYLFSFKYYKLDDVYTTVDGDLRNSAILLI